MLLIMKDLSLACLVFVDLFHPLWLFSCTCYSSRSGVELLVLLTEMLIDFYKTNFSTFFFFFVGKIKVPSFFSGDQSVSLKIFLR